MHRIAESLQVSVILGLHGKAGLDEARCELCSSLVFAVLSEAAETVLSAFCQISHTLHVFQSLMRKDRTFLSQAARFFVQTQTKSLVLF